MTTEFRSVFEAKAPDSVLLDLMDEEERVVQGWWSDELRLWVLADPARSTGNLITAWRINNEEDSMR